MESAQHEITMHVARNLAWERFTCVAFVLERSYSASRSHAANPVKNGKPRSPRVTVASSQCMFNLLSTSYPRLSTESSTGRIFRSAPLLETASISPLDSLKTKTLLLLYISFLIF